MHEIKFEFLYKNGTAESFSYIAEYNRESASELSELVNTIDEHHGNTGTEGCYRIPHHDSVRYIAKNEIVRVTITGIKSYAEKLIELGI